MKLELKHLAGYLPYGLKFMPTEYNKTENQLYYLSTINNSDEFGVNGFTSKWIKPILRPLSDLTKEIEVNGEKFVPIEKIDELAESVSYYSYDFYIKSTMFLPLWVVQKLLEWHFDIYGLIENNLSIDKNAIL